MSGHEEAQRIPEVDEDTSRRAYDQWHRNVHGHDDPATVTLEDWHHNALALAPALGDRRVLEVGCGVGDFAIHLTGLARSVTAVDFSPEAIALAQSKVQTQSRPATFQVADAQQLPFEDNAFDVLFSCECLEHVPNPQEAIAEMFRVLAPGGRLILTTENYSNAIILLWIACWWRKVPYNSGVAVQPIDHFFVFWQIRRWFREAGFQVTDMLGSHHVFLLLPRVHPHTFVVERFTHRFLAAALKPLARHMAFGATKP